MRMTAHHPVMATLQLRNSHRECRRLLSLVCLQSLSVLSASRLKSSTSPRTGPSMCMKMSNPSLAHSRNVPSPSRSNGKPTGYDTRTSGTDTWNGGLATNQTAITRAIAKTTLSSTWCENTRCRNPKSRRKRRTARMHLGPSLTECGRLSMRVTRKHPISPRRRSAASVEVPAQLGRSLRYTWHVIWRPSVFPSST